MLTEALLNMDVFVLVSGGDANIREIQQSLNAKYNAYFGLVACDGIYERSTNTALIYALQAEEGLSTSVANGVFGPTTTADCPTLSPRDEGVGHVATQQEIQNARQNVINNLADNVLPFLKGNLPTTEIEFDNLYNFSPVPGMEVTFVASESITLPGADYTSFTVSDGR